MEPSVLDLCEVREHLREDSMPFGEEGLQRREDFFVGEIGEAHANV
jgi:hypothetical protein